MAEYKQPPRSLISNVMMYATQSGTDLFTNKKPTRVINKDENTIVAFNLYMREAAQMPKDITVRYGFLDIRGQYFIDGTMTVHFDTGMSIFGMSFDMTDDEPGLYRVRFNVVGEDDPGVLFSFALIDNSWLNQALPIGRFLYPQNLSVPNTDISRVELHGTADPYNYWNADLISDNTIIMENYPVMMLNIFLSKAYQEDKNIVLRMLIRDDYGNVVLDQDTQMEVHPGYDRFAKSIVLKGSDESQFYTGLLNAEFSIDDGETYVLQIRVRSLEEVERQARLLAEWKAKAATVPTVPAKSGTDSFLEKVEKADRVITNTMRAFTAVSFGLAKLLSFGEPLDLGEFTEGDVLDFITGGSNQGQGYSSDNSYEMSDNGPYEDADDSFDFYKAFEVSDAKALINPTIGRGTEDMTASDYGRKICVYKNWNVTSGPVFYIIGNVIYEARYSKPTRPIYIIDGEYVYRAKNASVPVGGPLFWISDNKVLEMYYSSKISNVVYFFDDKYVYRPYAWCRSMDTEFDESKGDILFSLE